MSRPRLLDLFSGAGGATKGYQEAGFEVWGVDHRDQPNYVGDAFTREGALYVLERLIVGKNFGGRFDAIHASPPCQAFSSLKSMHNAKCHEDLLTPTRELLLRTGLPYIIENVPGAPLPRHPELGGGAWAIELCGTMFGLGAEGAELQRHRLFETNFAVAQLGCSHKASRVIGVYGGHGRDRRRTVNAQDFSSEARREAMGIDWMTGTELSQAIPPAYTRHIGSYLLAHISHEQRAAA